MKRILLLLGIVAAVVVFGFSLISVSGGADVSSSVVLTSLGSDISGYARADQPRTWQFPQDFGAHPDFQTEWWYYTGNLAAEDGRRFGYQFTIFRRAIAPSESDTGSEWRTNQLYMAHFAVSDVGGNRFTHDERFSRAGAGLAGAETEPNYRVWLGNWQVVGLNEDDTLTQISAEIGDAETGGVAVDFTLEQSKPPALQGVDGLSAKSAEVGNASYYYSLTRLLTDGTITIDGEVFTVSGTSWMDHEFGTSALGDGALGWDWFGLQLDDNRELMVGQIRQVDGGKDPYFGGLLVNPDGTTEYLPAEAITIEATGTWTSPHTGAVYPNGWTISVDAGDTPLRLTVTPQIADQELAGNGISYWEGTVRIEGDATGYGYAELTGYAESMMGRF